MKCEGYVVSKQDMGDEAEIVITNLRRVGGAGWREYNPGVKFNMPHGMAKAFELQRKVIIRIEPK